MGTRNDMPLYEKLRILMAEDMELRLSNDRKNYLASTNSYLNQKEQIIKKALENNVGALNVYAVLLNRRNRVESLRNAINNIAPLEMTSYYTELKSYYEPRRQIVEQMYKNAGVAGEFPSLPINFPAFWIQSPVLSKTKSEEIINWRISEVWLSAQQYCDAALNHFWPRWREDTTFPYLVLIDNLALQTTHLWGADSKTVFRCRYLFYINWVMSSALDLLKRVLPYVGADENGEVQKYRDMVYLICCELDDLAHRIDGCPDLSHYRKQYSNQEFVNRVMERRSKGETVHEAYINVLDEEYQCINNRYNMVSYV